MENIIYYLRKYCLYIIIVLMAIILVLTYLFLNQTNESCLEEEIDNNDIKVTSVINFDIKGAVNKPGVYNVIEGKTVNDAIILAGGLREDADTSTINLSKEVNNEMVIIIYTKEEIKNLSVGETAIKVIEKECVCPKVENNTCIDKNNLVDNYSSNDDKATNTGKVNINTADLKGLMTLSGIGESKAKAIIKYREDNGNFKTIDEITKVSGIGNSTFEKIKDNITV